MAKRKSPTPATADLGDGDSVLEDGPMDVDDAEPTMKR
jgi:adenosylmethionine-8-amino-7-oxononanoate aminotransferase